jgi:hypothetical protein
VAIYQVGIIIARDSGAVRCHVGGPHSCVVCIPALQAKKIAVLRSKKNAVRKNAATA